MIPSLSETALLLSGSIELSLVAKATVILLFGLATVQLARTSRASVRHVVIATSFAALAALPMLITAIPAMVIEVPASPAAIVQAGASTGAAIEVVTQTNGQATNLKVRRYQRGHGPVGVSGCFDDAMAADGVGGRRDRVPDSDRGRVVAAVDDPAHRPAGRVAP